MLCFGGKAEALYGEGQKLSDFLPYQDWLQTLSKKPLQTVSLEEFKNNFRCSFIQFPAHLKAGGASLIMVKAAGAVRRLARNAANLFCQSLEYPEKLLGTEEACRGISDGLH